ncbi:uncharacterized protein LOC126893900 [Daktulosphaira vitifoliae]|uniref:uncharacterized protein LOC126893900 n=1 Tax=Daktulosphaira vitifoliae TaxID=58002 RepID=UPI0021AA41DC|nr:uncharacterized protein LOC126893900 [Daktulosphaira vitifoliae]
MEINSLFFMTIVVFVLKPDEAEQSADYLRHYKNYRDVYKKYIKSVVGNICSQMGLKRMLNLKLKNDSNYTINIEKAFQSDASMANFKADYSYTISVLNYKYTEILKKILGYVDIILHKCKQFHEKNFTENFIYCVTLLVEEVKNSKTMLENLYNAMKFISYIDVRYVFKRIIVPNAIVDEIDFFKQFVLQYTSETVSFDLNSLPNLKDTEDKFKKLNEFYTAASEKVNNMFQNSNIIDTSVETNSITNQINECTNENDSYLVYLTCSNLNLYYDETIKIWYKNLGFDQFLTPRIPEFLPPIIPIINQNDGIIALNILRLGSGWKTMNHINIIYNGKSFSVDFIMKDKIDNVNFQIKKEHVTQLLRCRYTEIMKNYDVLLSVILHTCTMSAKHQYYYCLVELFDSLNKSKKMFNGLKSAITSLNESSIWSFNVRSHSSLQKIFDWVIDFLSLLNNNEFSKDKNVKNEKPITENVKKLLNIFSMFRNNFYKELKSDLNRMNDRCFMRKPFIEKFKIIYDLLPLTANPYSSQIYLTACNYFDNFCENVYKNCYEDLGFGKVENLNTN